LTHIRRRKAIAFTPCESICRTALFCYPYAFEA
jgi:hypothetical protein